MRKIVAHDADQAVVGALTPEVGDGLRAWLGRVREKLVTVNTNKIRAAEIREVHEPDRQRVKAFVNPYKSDPPYPVVVINNPSPNACQTAISELRDAFGDKVTIIQVVGNKNYKNPGADHIIQIKDKPGNWANPGLIMHELQKLALRHPVIQDKMQTTPPGFYCVWSSQAESPVMAKQARAAGFVWIGSSPEAVELIEGKRAFKRQCQALMIDTAQFFEFVDPPKDRVFTEGERNEYILNLAHQLLNEAKTKPEWAGKDVFVKSDWGGGGRGSKGLRFDRDAQGNITTTIDQVVAVLNHVIAGVDGRLDGLYFEESMLAPAAAKVTQQLFQLELEVVGLKREVGKDPVPVIAVGGRLVEFTPEFQKLLERGFADEEICDLISCSGLYDNCRQAIANFAKSVGYDNRGTMEFLIVKTVDNETGAKTWKVSATEMNCRRQVEALCNSKLVCYIDDTIGDDVSRLKRLNVTAGQFMASAGYNPPELGVHLVQDPEAKIVVHMRITHSHPGAKAWTYGGGYLLGHDGLPEFAKISLIPDGPILQSKDAQIGCVTFTATSMEQAIARQLEVAENLRIMGADGELSVDLWSFHRKLANNEAFIAGELSSNDASRVVSDPGIPKADIQVSSLAAIVNGWVNGFVPKGNGFPSDAEVQKAAEVAQLPTYMGEKRAVPVDTPYSRLAGVLQPPQVENEAPAEFKASQLAFLAEFHAAKKARLAAQGGGINDVTRDTFQQRFGSQSGPLMEPLMAIMRQYGASVFEYFEGGGAQQDVMLKSAMNPMDLFARQMNEDIGMMSLSRSRWLHSLYSKSEAEQRIILAELGAIVRKQLGLPEGSILPVTFNNFHAGNHASQDVTTRLMLEAGFQVIPNFVFNYLPGKDGAPDRGFTLDHAQQWIDRQLAVFGEAGIPLNEVRIKNPGQGPGWTADRVMTYLEVFAQAFRDKRLPVPVFHIHNHDADGLSTNVACEILEKCQKQGYLLVVDTGVPGVTHNDNSQLAAKLRLSPAQRTDLAQYNEAMAAQFKLLKGFDNEAVRKRVMPQDTPWALGTTTSDLLSAKDLGIPEAAISHLLQVSLDVFGCFGVVTPFSEILKSFAFSFPAALGIDPRNVDALQAAITPESICEYISTKGGKFDVDQRYLVELQRWESLVDRPAIVETLLANHGLGSREVVPPSEAGQDQFVGIIDNAKAYLTERFPNVEITNREVAIYLGWGPVGESYLDRCNNYSNQDSFASHPWDMYAAPKPRTLGEIVEVDGVRFKLTAIEPVEGRAQTVFSFVKVDVAGNQLNAKIYKVRALNKAEAIDLGLMRKVVLAAGRYGFFGSKSGGSLQSLHVEEGKVLKTGDLLYEIVYCKMMVKVMVPPALNGKVVAEVFASDPPFEVTFDEQLFRFVDPPKQGI